VSSLSSVRDRIEGWLGREDRDRSVARFRRVFAGIWVVYDSIDLLLGATEHARNWFPHPRETGLIAIQLALVVCGVQLLRERRTYAFAMIAAALRLLEGLAFFNLNDFYFYSITMLLLAHGDGGPFEQGKRPLWVRHALLVELGWIYFATALMKMNPDWMGGGHLYVRTEYLSRALGWPYPTPLRAAFQSLAVDAVLARLAIAAELALALVLWARRPYWLGVLLVVCIHAFGTIVTNVWFFSASTITAVVLLLPRSRRGADHDGAVDHREQEEHDQQ
jgi:hypothetical protein